MAGPLGSARHLVAALVTLALLFGINGFVGAIHSVHHLSAPVTTHADELSLPTFLHIKEPGGQVTSISGEFSKRIFPDLGLTFEGEWNLFDPADNRRTENGFGNLEMSLKYQVFTSAVHEAILSAAFGWEAGGTGRKKAGAESFDVFKPALLFGKGMGKNVGIRGQVHFFLDDLFPTTIGRPLFTW